MVKCPLCGRENPEGSRFCASCGEPLAVEASQPTPSHPLRPLKSDGRGTCPFCRRTVDIYFGRCSYCGEPMDLGQEAIEMSPTNVAGDVSGVEMEHIVSELVESALNKMVDEGRDIRDVKDSIVRDLRVRAEELVKARMGTGKGDGSLAAATADVGPLIEQEAREMVPQSMPQGAGANTSRTTVHIGMAKGESRRLDKQKECFICLGTIGPNDAFLTCECGMSYHSTCAADVGYCPNCGKKFNL